jgi:hypothetical protein
MRERGTAARFDVTTPLGVSAERRISLANSMVRARLT